MEKDLLLDFERSSKAHEDESHSLFDLVCICHLKVSEDFILRNV